MPLLCPIGSLKDNHEIVICDSEPSRQAHKELFRMADDVYITADDAAGVFNAVAGIVNSFNSASSNGPSKIHMALGWETLLKITVWNPNKPTIGDAFTILKKAGITSGELQPFKKADVNDMFPWLYYGKRFDILKRLCHSAKKQAETRMKKCSIRVDCHLIAEDTKRIVASSL